MAKSVKIPIGFDVRLLITQLVYCAHCIVCPLIYSFWLPYWYLHTFGHCIVCPLIYSFWLPCWVIRSCKSKDSQYSDQKCEDTNRVIRSCRSKDRQCNGHNIPIWHFWPLHCLSFDSQLLITLLVSCGHCIDCPLIYVFWLIHWPQDTNRVIRRRKSKDSQYNGHKIPIGNQKLWIKGQSIQWPKVWRYQ
jgi:hypothetical protein